MRNMLRTGAIFLLACMICGGMDLGWLSRAHGQITKKPGLLDSVRTVPTTPRTGDKVKLLFHPSEELVRAEITWTVNGEVVQTSDYDLGNKNVELDKPIKSGDVIVATIVPYEAGGTQGRTVEHRVVCGNAPPILKVENQEMNADGLYTAKIDAKNPQGGSVKLKLERGPKGLTMDPEGNIQWQVSKNTSGRFSVKVVGEDAEGQKTFLTYEIGISWQQR